MFLVTLLHFEPGAPAIKIYFIAIFNGVNISQ